MGYDIFSANLSATFGDILAAVGSTVRKIASGQKLNSAADNAAAVAVQQLLRADIAAVQQGVRNISDAVSMLQTADGAASVISNNVIRMTELTAQATAGTLSDDQKQILQREYEQLVAQNQLIAETFQFNGVELFGGNQTIDIAFGDGNSISVAIPALPAASGEAISSVSALEKFKTIVADMSSFRGNIGSTMKRLEAAAEVVNTTAENTLAAESRISDTDIAREIASLTAAKVKSQAAIACQAQANITGNIMLELLGN